MVNSDTVNSMGRYELVEHSKIFICLSVPLVMLNGSIQPNGFEGRLFVRSDNIPAHAAVCQVVQRGEALCEQERLFKRGRGCDAKSKILGHSCHCSDGLLESQNCLNCKTEVHSRWLGPSPAIALPVEYTHRACLRRYRVLPWCLPGTEH